MGKIDNLDRVLYYVCNFSRDLASIPTPDLSVNTGIEIDELTEYLDELKDRGYINHYEFGSYITLKGRLAIENAKNGTPFREEVNNKKLKKYWSVTKITAGVLNALAIIGIAFWTQFSSINSSKLENDFESLKKESQIELAKKTSKIDSLSKVIKDLKSQKAIEPSKTNNSE